MQKDKQDINKHSIDAVITWVDGNDREHIKKRLKVYEDKYIDKNSVPTGFDNTRFVDNGELKYCIKSIRKFAPWIRNIYLVTDNQVPDFLTPDLRNQYNVIVVDHHEIFESYEWALPTFNSRTIESALWRIPGLADRFIYFNDDFVITREVYPTDFFKNGKVVLRGRWNGITRYGKMRLKLNNLVSFVAKKLFGITRSMHLLLQMRSAKLAGFNNRYFRSPHVPHPVQTYTLKQFFDQNPALFEKNIKYQLRNTEQFSAIHIANHLEIKQKNSLLRDASDTIMINGEMDIFPIIKRKLDKIESNGVRFVCLQGFENFKLKHREHIKQYLNKLFD